MRTFQIIIAPSARKSLLSLPRAIQVAIAEKIDSLVSDPRPHGVKKLEGHKDRYRVRVGDYRIIYKIADKKLQILIIRIGHRKEVYRG